MNRSADTSETLFELAHRQRRNGDVIDHVECGLRNELLDLAEIGRIVCRDSHASVLSERPMHGCHKAF